MVHLCFVSRIARLNKRRTRKKRLLHVFIILEETLKQFKFSCKILLDLLWLEYFRRYRHTIPEPPIFIQISYWVNLIPRNYAIPEWLTTCRYFGFWQNEYVFSCFTMLVTVSKGRRKFLLLLNWCLRVCYSSKH